jgi:hypothetical protein
MFVFKSDMEFSLAVELRALLRCDLPRDEAAVKTHINAPVSNCLARNILLLKSVVVAKQNSCKAVRLSRQ